MGREEAVVSGQRFFRNGRFDPKPTLHRQTMSLGPSALLGDEHAYWKLI